MRPTSSHPADPSPQPRPTPLHQGPASPSGRGPSEQWVFGSLLLPDWNRRHEEEMPPSLYMMSATTRFLSITFSLVSCSWLPGSSCMCVDEQCERVFPVCVCVWATQFGETGETIGLKKDLYPFHKLSYYWACKCYSTGNISMLVSETLAVWRWHVTHSFTKKDLSCTLARQPQTMNWLTSRGS